MKHFLAALMIVLAVLVVLLVLKPDRGKEDAGTDGVRPPGEPRSEAPDSVEIVPPLPEEPTPPSDDVVDEAGAEDAGIERTATGARGTIAIRAVDPEGRPVEGLALCLDEAGGMGFALHDEYPLTDQDGRAAIAPYPWDRDALDRGLPRFVIAQVLAEHPVQAPVDASSLVGGEVELRVPATGRLRGHVRDPQGRSVQAGRVVLFWRPGGTDPGARSDPSAAHVGLRFQDGSFLSPPVEVGSDVHVRLTLTDELSVVPVTVPGPRAPGEIVEVDFDAVCDAIVVARLVDPAGEPLRNRKLRATWTMGRPGDLDRERVPRRPFNHYEHVETDEDGVVCLRWTLHFFDEFRLGDLTLRRDGREDPPHWSGELTKSPAVRVDLPPVLAPGANDLGTLVFAPLPLLVAGKVVDERGEGIAGVRVRVECQRRADAPDHWRDEQHVYVHSHDDGTFEVRAFLEDVGSTFEERALDYRLHVEAKEGHLDVRTPFRPGQEGVKAVLAAAGRVDVEPLCDDPEYSRGMRFHLRREGSERNVHGPRRLSWEHLRWNVVPPGTYELCVMGERPWILLAHVEGIEVEAGELLRDPRLCPLDLRGKLRLLTLIVRDEKGLLIPDPRGRILENDGTGQDRLSRDGEVKLLIPEGSEWDVVVSAKGYRPVLVENLTEDREIALRPDLRVTLRLLGGPENLDATNLDASLRHADDSPFPEELRRTPRRSYLRFDGNRETVMSLPGPGRYVLSIGGPPSFADPETWSREGRGLKEHVDLPFWVREEDDGEILVVELPPE